jgi:hypothetical protein
MSYTKRQFIEAAHDEIGLASYTFDLQPQQLESALRRLDAMMAEWNARGLRLAYPLPSSPQNSDIDAETNVPDSANQAIICNLALLISSSYGKTPMPQTMMLAKKSYDTLLARAAMPSEQQFPETLPRGAGQKPWRYNGPFMPRPVDPVLTGPEGKLEF